MNPATLPQARPAEPVARSPLPQAVQAATLACVLDEMDQGLVVVDLGGNILHANHPARRELAGDGALLDRAGQLLAATAEGQARIRQALRDAARDCRSVVELAHASNPLTLAFVPLASPAPGSAIDTVLVMCSRRAGVQSLTVQMFARARRLTGAEQAVLSQLCAGRGANEIAGLQGICLSTVRTHIKNVRQKTGASSIGEVVQRVLHLPQIVPALRLANMA